MFRQGRFKSKPGTVLKITGSDFSPPEWVCSISAKWTRRQPSAYRLFIEQLKTRVVAARISAARAVCSDMILLYWDTGRGIAEKQRTLGQKKYFIDLLFYHRFLKALVAFELKVGSFEPEHAGKMDFYLTRPYRLPL